MKVSTVSSRQPSTVPVIEIRAAGEGVGAVEGAQPALAGPEGLPAGSGGQGLTLCKETTDLLFTGELSKNSSVPQHTPGERQAAIDQWTDGRVCLVQKRGRHGVHYRSSGGERGGRTQGARRRSWAAGARVAGPCPGGGATLPLWAALTCAETSEL